MYLILLPYGICYHFARRLDPNFLDARVSFAFCLQRVQPFYQLLKEIPLAAKTYLLSFSFISNKIDFARSAHRSIISLGESYDDRRPQPRHAAR